MGPLAEGRKSKRFESMLSPFKRQDLFLGIHDVEPLGSAPLIAALDKDGGGRIPPSPGAA